MPHQKAITAEGLPIPVKDALCLKIVKNKLCSLFLGKICFPGDIVHKAYVFFCYNLREVAVEIYDNPPIRTNVDVCFVRLVARVFLFPPPSQKTINYKKQPPRCRCGPETRNVNLVSRLKSLISGAITSI